MTDAEKDDERKIYLAELYARDPREMTDADFDLLISALREAREKFVFENDKKAGSLKPRSAAAKKQSKMAAIQLDVKL